MRKKGVAGVSKSPFKATLPSIFDSLSSPSALAAALIVWNRREGLQLRHLGRLRTCARRQECTRRGGWRLAFEKYITPNTAPQRPSPIDVYAPLTHTHKTHADGPLIFLRAAGEQERRGQRRRTIGRGKKEGETMIIPFVCFVISGRELLAMQSSAGGKSSTENSGWRRSAQRAHDGVANF